MSRIRTSLIAVGLLAVAAPAADARITVTGRGFGHGVGLSQYGAYGYALRENRDATWILDHYYPGTSVTDGPRARMRVLLKSGSQQTVCGATRVGDGRRRLRLVSSHAYRVRSAPGGRLRVSDVRTGDTRAVLRAPLRITGGESVCLRGKAANGLRDGTYRGAMRLVRSGSRILAVDDVAMADYLAGVVPAEMPTTWSTEAIRAQAIVARSYAIRERSPSRAFDVYPDTRSQVYRGRSAETLAGTAAVRATEPRVVSYQGEVAQTFFSSTSGGRTASNEEAFSGTPVAYLRSVVDAHDDISPVHTWTETFSAGVAEARLGDLVRGRLKGLTVARRGPSGRVLSVEVAGSRGSRTTTGAAVRARLRLRSTWFQVSSQT